LTWARDGEQSARKFDHERLDVYQKSLDFLVLANDLIQALPRGRSHIADQLERAATSIVLNIAEGAGKFSPGDKRRYYLSAAGSATECAAVLDILLRLALASSQAHEQGKGVLERIVSMLVKLAKVQEDR
jgi:four helix bundle protein